MHKNDNGFTIILFFIIVLIVFGITVLGLLTFSRSKPHLNQQVTISAENYIISKVGNERFHKLFRLDSRKSSDTDSDYGSRAYHFSMLNTVTDDDLVIVQVDRKIPSQTFGNLVPSCVQDSTQCSFNVNKQQALSIAKNNGFNATDLKTNWDSFRDTPKLAIAVTSCAQNKTMWINYADGHVLGVEDTVICGGTP